MKLHWSPRSPYVRKVMVCAHELKLEKQIQLVRSTVEITAPNDELMRDNPLSKIPTLVLDDGRVLFDSVVICEYLDASTGKPWLFPSQPRERWPALRWLAYGDGLTDMLILWRDERRREKPSPIHLSAYQKKVSVSLDGLEKETVELEKAKTAIGHMSIGCTLGYLDFRFADLAWREGRPKLAGWFAGFSRRPSMQQTTPKEG